MSTPVTSVSIRGEHFPANAAVNNGDPATIAALPRDRRCGEPIALAKARTPAIPVSTKFKRGAVTLRAQVTGAQSP